MGLQYGNGVRVVAGVAAGALLSVGAAVLALAAPAVHAASAPRDGPFGIYMGEPLSDLQVIGKADVPHQYVVKAPRPNAQFPLVSVFAYPSTGVCQVAGLSEALDADATGERARSIVDHVAEVLATKYGPYDDKRDECDDSDAACAQNWTLEVLQQQARYAYVWRSLPSEKFGGVSQMLVRVVTTTATAPRVSVFYDSNTAACNAAKSASDAGGL